MDIFAVKKVNIEKSLLTKLFEIYIIYLFMQQAKRAF
jgi:hypothetical protein